MDTLLVSIIILQKDKDFNIDGLLCDISRQKTSFDHEIVRVIGVRPQGSAINEGTRRASGNIIVIMDCDIRLVHENVLANLIEPLLKQDKIGAVCASMRIPANASQFQVRYTREIPHSETPLVDTLTDVYVATSACCASFKEIFFKVGAFNGEIVRGIDSDFSLRLQEAGYRVVIAPGASFYHPPPGNMWKLFKINFRNGLGVIFVDAYYPDLVIDVDPRGVQYVAERKSKLERTQRFISSFFVSLFQGKFLLFLAKLTYAAGYFYGFFKYRILKLTS